MGKTEATLTQEQKAILDICALNKAEKKDEVRKEFRIGKYKMAYHWKSKNCLWGRFGGGWNWKLGIQVGGSTVIVDLLTFSLRFAKVTPQPKTTGENGAAISTK